ncbi:MAG: hypothetical protein GY816_23830, partial [Cytophagales bacterium]|nr:hypothetical protein [Cytophagales bacterium]
MSEIAFDQKIYGELFPNDGSECFSELLVFLSWHSEIFALNEVDGPASKWKISLRDQICERFIEQASKSLKLTHSIEAQSVKKRSKNTKCSADDSRTDLAASSETAKKIALVLESYLDSRGRAKIADLYSFVLSPDAKKFDPSLQKCEVQGCLRSLATPNSYYYSGLINLFMARPSEFQVGNLDGKPTYAKRTSACGPSVTSRNNDHLLGKQSLLNTMAMERFVSNEPPTEEETEYHLEQMRKGIEMVQIEKEDEEDGGGRRNVHF